MTVQKRRRGDNGMTDSLFESCIQQIRCGDKTGLRKIYDEYGKIIYSVMLTAVKNSHDAEDLTSDFFLKLWDKLADAYKSGGGHKRWLTVTAHNMAVDFLRRKNRVQLVSDENEEGLPEPVSNDDTESTVIGSMSVKEALEKLSDDEREIVNLKLFADLTFKDIAYTLDKPIGTVAWKYRSAVSKLRKYIKEVQTL